jgi:hypothetical protein
VIEGRALPPQRSRSILLRQFGLAEWIVPPVIIPVFPVIIVIAVAVLHA